MSDAAVLAALRQFQAFCEALAARVVALEQAAAQRPTVVGVGQRDTTERWTQERLTTGRLCWFERMTAKETLAVLNGLPGEPIPNARVIHHKAEYDGWTRGPGPTGVSVAVAETGPPAEPAAASAEARWNDCVIYCLENDLPRFDGDMLHLNRHRERRGLRPYVLIEPMGPPKPAHANGEARA